MMEKNGYLSPIEVIRQKEAEITRQVAAARVAAEKTVAEARAQAAREIEQAKQDGLIEGRQLFETTITQAQEMADEIIRQAQEKAEEIKRRGELELDHAISLALRLVIGEDIDFKPQARQASDER